MYFLNKDFFELLKKEDSLRLNITNKYISKTI